MPQRYVNLFKLHYKKAFFSIIKPPWPSRRTATAVAPPSPYSAPGSYCDMICKLLGISFDSSKKKPIFACK